MADDTPRLAELLACPRCDTALSPGRDAGFECPACEVRYPLLDGMPFLFAAPGAARGAWQARVHHELRRLEARASRLADELAGDGLLPATRERLEWVRAACIDQQARLSALLAPLLADTAPAARETYLALRTRLPTDQGLNTYYQNVHRDWGWGDAENEAAEVIVCSLLAPAPGKVLVLGAGSGRLSYDLHQATAATLTVALDFNPLLLGIGRRVSGGDTVALWEFPVAPRRARDHAVLRQFTAEPVRPGLDFVLGDALRAPFAPGTFDTVVTPWLVDILPEDFAGFAARVNRLLAPGGRWVNFGSLAFDAPDEARRYTLEESVALLERAGFGSVQTREDVIPYLCSPASRHARREEVVSFSAAKAGAAEWPGRHRALPEWLVSGKEAVPALREFQLQAATNRIFAYVMGLIDGRRSIRDMAAHLEAERLMPGEEAEGVIRDFLVRMYEDSRKTELS